MTFSLSAYFKEKAAFVDDALLTRWLPAATRDPATLHEAMRYSVTAGGKRVRPVLVFAAAQALGIPDRDVLPIAAALEMIHVFSLIHDDLPAMDDDDYRRGKPANHVQFGEATAILAGNALLVEAFGWMSKFRKNSQISSDVFLMIVEDIARACGANGMIGGQFLDIQLQEKGEDEINYPQLEFLYIRKTGNLILVAITSGAKLSGATPKQIKALTQYGENLGLAFQLVDDILDMHDNYRGPVKIKKPIFPPILSLNESRQRSLELASRAIEALKDFDHRADPLREIATYVVERKQ